MIADIPNADHLDDANVQYLDKTRRYLLWLKGQDGQEMHYVLTTQQLAELRTIVEDALLAGMGDLH